MSETTIAPQDPLTTGWEPGLDPGDTLLRRFVLHLAECFASAAHGVGGEVVRSPGLVVADRRRPWSHFNSAVLLQPPPPDAWDDVLDDVGAAFAPGTGGAYLWSLWPTPDLRSKGWQLVGHPPILIRRPGGRLPPAPEGLVIEEVGDDARLDDCARVAVEGYPFPDLMPYRPGCLFVERLLADARWRFWVGYDDGSPVAMGALFVSHDIAQLALGVTLPHARGRGYWYGLVRQRLLAEPRLLSAGVFGDDSRPGMERLDFLPIIRLTLWHRERPA